MQRRRETSNERYKRVIRQRRIFVLSVFVIVVMLCVCLFTPLFGITDITVNGNAVLSSEDIITTSGIEKGENVFRISKKKAQKALSTLAYVEGVTINRKFPARIEINIDEAKPDIIFDTPTQFIVTTAGGRVLEMTDDVTHLTSPIVYGVSVTWAEPAKNIETEDQELFAMNMEYIRCFYDTEHWQNIDEIYVSDVTNFMVVMKSGMKVTFGSIENAEVLQRKIMMMTKIFEQVEQTENSYLDLTTDKGYYGEYTQAELEAMERAAEKEAGQQVQESDSDGENADQEETSQNETSSQDEAKPSEEPNERKKGSGSQEQAAKQDE